MKKGLLLKAKNITRLIISGIFTYLDFISDIYMTIVAY